MALGVAGFHLIGSFTVHRTKKIMSWTSINESMQVTNLSKQRAAGKHTIIQPDINDKEMQTLTKLSKFKMSTSNHMNFFMQPPSILLHGARCR
jgi:hypothetical protein